MKPIKLIQKIWHDLYYAGTPNKRLEFGLRCRHAVELIDLNDHVPPQLRLRVRLHTSLCEPCANYLKWSKVLKKSILTFVPRSSQANTLVALNRDLLKKYRRS